MAQTREGAIKSAAKHMGITPDEYKRRVAAGQKWCTKGKHWQGQANFTVDRSRVDGLSASCVTCRLSGKRPGPSLVERRARFQSGERWCKGCQSWLPAADVRGGRCLPHIASEQRRRYAENESTRLKIRQQVRSRKRGVAPILVEAQRMLLDYFEGLCAYCPDRATTWDHIIPISLGGRTTPGNIVPACASCNSSKGPRDVLQWSEATGRQPSDQFWNRYVLAWAGLYG